MMIDEKCKTMEVELPVRRAFNARFIKLVIDVTLHR